LTPKCQTRQEKRKQRPNGPLQEGGNKPPSLKRKCWEGSVRRKRCQKREIQGQTGREFILRPNHFRNLNNKGRRRGCLFTSRPRERNDPFSLVRNRGRKRNQRGRGKNRGRGHWRQKIILGGAPGKAEVWVWGLINDPMRSFNPTTLKNKWKKKQPASKKRTHTRLMREMGEGKGAKLCRGSCWGRSKRKVAQPSSSGRRKKL